MKRYIKSSYRSVDPEELEDRISRLEERLDDPSLSWVELQGILDMIEICKRELSDSYDYNRDPYQWEL